MKLRSITDVITNSSTEVFCYKLDDPEYQEAKTDIPWLTWNEFRTEDDVKKLVMDPDYWGLPWFYGDQNDHGPEEAIPLYDIMSNYDFREGIEGKKTTDEIWEFVKSFYLDGILGKAVATFENDCISSAMYEDVRKFQDRKYKERLDAHLSQFVPGDVLEVDLRYPVDKINRTVLVKKVTDNDYEAIKESWEKTGILRRYDPSIIDGPEWIHLVRPLTARKYEDKK